MFQEWYASYGMCYQKQGLAGNNDSVQKIENSVDASIAKTMAITWGLQLTLDLKLNKIIVHSDDALVVAHIIILVVLEL